MSTLPRMNSENRSVQPSPMPPTSDSLRKCWWSSSATTKKRHSWSIRKKTSLKPLEAGSSRQWIRLSKKESRSWRKRRKSNILESYQSAKIEIIFQQWRKRWSHQRAFLSSQSKKLWLIKMRLKIIKKIMKKALNNLREQEAWGTFKFCQGGKNSWWRYFSASFASTETKNPVCGRTMIFTWDISEKSTK